MKVRGIRSSLMMRCVSILCMILMIAQVEIISAISAGAADLALATNFTHTAPEFVQTGRRIVIKSNISDPSGIKLARCYFRASSEVNYVFVTMEQGADNSFKAVLPAISDNAQSLQYCFLAVNNAGQISKTNEFSTEVKKGKVDFSKSQDTANSEPIKVGIEVEKPGNEVAGFSDNITVDVVESSARFMLVSGVGVAAGTSAASGTAGGAATATTASGGSGTIMGMKASTFWLIVAGATAVAVGGVAVASGGGGGGGGSSAKSGSVKASW